MGKEEWIDVSMPGLSKLLAKRGKGWIIAELLQNCWDEDGVTKVDVTLAPIPNRPAAQLIVKDDAPDGFCDLAHSYTLFAESYKKEDPEKRGRFNLGEKLVLSMCEDAVITTTTGQVVFSKTGRTKVKEPRTKAGSTFSATIRITRDEIVQVQRMLDMLLEPDGITTTFNGKPLTKHQMFDCFEETLPTLRSDEDGNLLPTKRKTVIEVYEVKEGEEAYLYEMGIPVVDTGDKWHVNICQKVPLNMDRDNVTPSYLRKVRTLVLNHMHNDIDEEDANAPWARDAVADPDADPKAVERSLDLRFGKKRVVFDPSDTEANKLAVSKGYTVIHGSQLSKKEWANVKRDELAQPAGQVTPSPKPYSDDPNADPVDIIPREKWTEDQFKVVEYIQRLHEVILDKPLRVTIVNTTNGFSACYAASGRLDLNIKRLGHEFFRNAARGGTMALNDLLIHEFAHFYASDHLSEEYHKALTKIGAMMIHRAILNPELFEV
jgi:hypothetical protein